MKNLGYYVAPEDVGVEMRSIASQHPEVLSAPRRDLDLIEPGYYLEAIGAFRGFIQDIQKARPKLEEQQIHAEMEISTSASVKHGYGVVIAKTPSLGLTSF